MRRNPFRHIATLLDHLGSQLQAELGRNVLGLYVYGSLTQNAFDARRSDVDCVAVVRRRLSRVVASRLRTSLRRLSARHSWMRRLQLTILIQRELLQFNGDGWLYQFGRLSRTGSDGNPIIWANILESGQVVFGASPHTFVPPITPGLMRAALEREMRAEFSTPWRMGGWSQSTRRRLGRFGAYHSCIGRSSDGRLRGHTGHGSFR